MTHRTELDAAKEDVAAGLTPITAAYVYSRREMGFVPCIIYRYDLEAEVRAADGESSPQKSEG